MDNKGTIKCRNCENEIKWVKWIRNKASAPIYEVTSFKDSESVVNNNNEVRCKVCDELNTIE